MNKTDQIVNSDIKNAQKRAYRYYYSDGWVEISSGILFCLIGLLFWIESRMPAGSPWRSLSAFGLPLLVIGGMFAVTWLVRSMKERITYPRTGFVSYQRPARRRRLWPALLGFVIGGGVAFIISSGEALHTMLPALQGGTIAFFLLYLAYRLDLFRYYLLALVSAALGVALSLLKLVDPLGSAGYFGGMGLILLLVGLFVLVGYLRRTTLAGQNHNQDGGEQGVSV